MTDRIKVIEAYGLVFEMIARGLNSDDRSQVTESIDLLPGFQVEEDRVTLFDVLFQKSDLEYAVLSEDSWEAESLIDGLNAVPNSVTSAALKEHLSNLTNLTEYQTSKVHLLERVLSR